MSKIIREVNDCKDIQLAIHTTLNDFMQEYNLTGWIRNSNENDIIQLLKDNTKLLKENNLLHTQIQELQNQIAEQSTKKLGNFSFDDIVKLFKTKVFKVPADVARADKDVNINALDLYIIYHEVFTLGISNELGTPEPIIYIFNHIVPYYINFDFLERVKLYNTNAQRIHTTKLGSAFYAMLEMKNMTKNLPK